MKASSHSSQALTDHSIDGNVDRLPYKYNEQKVHSKATSWQNYRNEPYTLSTMEKVGNPVYSQHALSPPQFTEVMTKDRQNRESKETLMSEPQVVCSIEHQGTLQDQEISRYKALLRKKVGSVAA